MNWRLKPSCQLKQQLIGWRVSIGGKAGAHPDLPIIGNEVRRTGVPRHHDAAICGTRDLLRGIFYEGAQRFSPLLVEHQSADRGRKRFAVGRRTVADAGHETEREVVWQFPRDHRA